MARRVPKPADLAPLMQFRKPQFNAKRRRLERALTIEDLRRIAKRRTPTAAFDYTDGAAEEELSLARARQAFRDIEFHPAILRDVSAVDTSCEILGERSSLPFGVAPTGFTRMMQSEGEYAGARSAAAAGIPFSLSTMGTASIEDVVEAAPTGRHWFQLYMWKDRERSMALVDRAAAAGYDTLLVTVDVPVAGARLRDTRNGMSIPPALTARTVLDALPRPAWWFDFLTTEPLAFASLDRWSGTVADLLDTMFDPTVTFDDLTWIKEQWPGKLVVKGIQTLDDARAVAALGVDGIVLSNHGGRQLDRAPIPFHLLPEVAAEFSTLPAPGDGTRSTSPEPGDNRTRTTLPEPGSQGARSTLPEPGDEGARVEGNRPAIILDTGIMSGADIVAAIALGADFTLIGRAYLYGLMAGGQEGVDRTIEILRSQIERTMRLLGVASLDELGPNHVTQLERMVPRSRA
ncbi:alpha-hydroxy-acid oxidizing protein [Gordonia sp. PP30]|uniref:alpha-hydroxy acid oxidase n=1 Tax=Gordonia sp. PP30 TaxID=2935861 RepID=UPI0020004846|nr:alpha-hydroxy acid oxidase [Gordonia sp. PP30]UQE73755.1 alpha-hydroxy-acid oxidizing protein [Gordonia sp. PP30]